MKLMKVLFALFVITATAGQLAYASDPDIKWIEKAVDITVKDHDIPAVVVAVIKDGEVKKFVSRGSISRTNARRVNEKTLFQIGSLSKTFTSMIARQLEKQGKIDVNSSIVRYLPDSVSDTVKKKFANVTLNDLLQHTSGFPNGSAFSKRKGNDPMVIGYTEAELLKDLELMTLKSKGTWRYSNLGFGVVGYLLERATGQSYDSLLKEHVTSKLRMKDTATTPVSISRRAVPYRKENRFIETKPWTMGKMVSAGGIYSNANDLSKLLIAQMSVYRKERKDSFMHLTGSLANLREGLDYGWGMFVDKAGKYGHSGDLDGFGSNYMFLPEKNIGIVVLSSSGGAFWMPQFENLLISRLRGLDPKLPEVRPSIQLDSSELKKYEGTYMIETAGLEIALKIEDENLFAYPKGDFGPIPLSFAAPGVIYSRTSSAKFIFETPKDGEESIILIYRGNRLPAKRVK